MYAEHTKNLRVNEGNTKLPSFAAHSYLRRLSVLMIAR